MPGDVCPRCGSARGSVPWLNRAALTLMAFFFGAPPLGLVYLAIVDWLAGAGSVDVISRYPLEVLGLIFPLFLAVASGSAAWQGRLPRWTSRLLGSDMNKEFERVLSSRTYAIALVLINLIAVTAVTTIFVV